jgi:hypothetical protein
MPNTSTIDGIDGIDGIKPTATQMKNGSAMAIPSTLNNFLVASNKGLRFLNLCLTPH